MLSKIAIHIWFEKNLVNKKLIKKETNIKGRKEIILFTKQK